MTAASAAFGNSSSSGHALQDLSGRCLCRLANQSDLITLSRESVTVEARRRSSCYESAARCKPLGLIKPSIEIANDAFARGDPVRKEST